MEDKIEVGEYVRLGYGKIDQVKNNDYYMQQYIECERGLYPRENIVKHSKNIIDLIEEGDVIVYFSNSLGIYIKCEVSYVCSKQEDYKSGEGYVSTVLDDLIRIEDIRTIVTKEQFNSIKYEID